MSHAKFDNKRFLRGQLFFILQVDLQLGIKLNLKKRQEYIDIEKNTVQYIGTFNTFDERIITWFF